MSFPYDLHVNFEGAGNDDFDASDVGTAVTYPHYTQLCATPPFQPPYRGAYCMKIDLASQSAKTEHSVQHNALDMSANVTRFIRWYMYVHNLVMAASDRFSIFSIAATATDHVLVEIFNNAGTIELRCGQNNTGGTLRSTPLIQDKWLAIEVGLNPYDGDGAGSDGVIEFFVDHRQVGADLTGLTQATSTQMNLGVFVGADAAETNSGITSGILLFDEFVVDGVAGTAGTRNFGHRQRFEGSSRPLRVDKDGHAVIGQGSLRRVTLVGPTGSNDGQLHLYDTDEANTSDASNLIIPPIVQLNNAEVLTFEVLGDMGTFERGCYVDIGGTADAGGPYALLEFDRLVNSEERIRQHARYRKPHGIL